MYMIYLLANIYLLLFVMYIDILIPSRWHWEVLGGQRRVNMRVPSIDIACQAVRFDRERLVAASCNQ